MATRAGAFTFLLGLAVFLAGCNNCMVMALVGLPCAGTGNTGTVQSCSGCYDSCMATHPGQSAYCCGWCWTRCDGGTSCPKSAARQTVSIVDDVVAGCSAWSGAGDAPADPAALTADACADAQTFSARPVVAGQTLGSPCACRDSQCLDDWSWKHLGCGTGAEIECDGQFVMQLAPDCSELSVP
jgi:hypothetical protein